MSINIINDRLQKLCAIYVNESHSYKRMHALLAQIYCSSKRSLELR